MIINLHICILVVYVFYNKVCRDFMVISQLLIYHRYIHYIIKVKLYIYIYIYLVTRVFIAWLIRVVTFSLR
jgi:hypothetical protein